MNIAGLSVPGRVWRAPREHAGPNLERACLSLGGMRLNEESHTHMSHALRSHLCERDGEETGGCQDLGRGKGSTPERQDWEIGVGPVLYPNRDCEVAET